MNSIHNNGPDDKQLNDELKKLAQDYRQNSPEEPPELLDQAILNSAHRAVENKDHWLDFGWIHGLATAAVVVLALSIILTQRPPTGLEENGLPPVDLMTSDRDQAAESEMSGKMREQRVGELDYMRAEPKQELSKDSGNPPSNMIGRTLPAASAPEAQTGARNEPMAARKAQSEVRAKESMRLKKVLADERRIEAVTLNAYKVDAKRPLIAPPEEQLQTILLLKRKGDETWQAKLKTFIENYPDYPLPEELKN